MEVRSPLQFFTPPVSPGSVRLGFDGRLFPRSLPWESGPRSMRREGDPPPPFFISFYLRSHQRPQQPPNPPKAQHPAIVCLRKCPINHLLYAFNFSPFSPLYLPLLLFLSAAPAFQPRREKAETTSGSQGSEQSISSPASQWESAGAAASGLNIPRPKGLTRGWKKHLFPGKRGR